jgi:hypothetical protein
MKTNRISQLRSAGIAAVAAFALAACMSMGSGNVVSVTLSGANEVPPTTSTATGTGSFTIGTDKSVSGSLTVTGMEPTASHIHMAPAGKNGPVIVPFKQDGNTFSAQPGATLTDEQYAAFKAGGLYVNVHSKAFPGGEIRAQLAPK